MTSNLMELYVKKTKKFLKEFTKEFFLEQYDEFISNEYIDTYIEARIHNFNESRQRFFFRRIHFSLMKKKRELIENNKKIDEVKLENNLKLYQYVYFIDGVRSINDLKEFTKMICEKRINLFKLETTRIIEEKLYKMIRDYRNGKEKFFKEFNSDDFELKIEKYTLIDNTYRVELIFRFKIPYIYSKEVIKEVFDAGTINEDKLTIEYVMLTGQCIKDIENANFGKRYLVDFAVSLFEKEKKIKQVLRVIDDTAIQDKIVLKIHYEDFMNNKEKVYELMRDGFRFGVILNDTFMPTLLELKKIEMFEYILVPKEFDSAQDIKENEKRIESVVIYDC